MTTEPDDATMVNRIMQSMNLADREEELFGIGESMTVRTIAATTDTLNATMPVGFRIPDHVARRLAREGGSRLLGTDIVGQTRQALFRALAEGRAEGLAGDGLARRIRQNVSAGRFRNAGVNYRAKLIARTETLFTQNESTLTAYGSSGVANVELIDDQLGHGDEPCVLRNGQVMTIAEARSVSDHPNGTLMMVPAAQ